MHFSKSYRTWWSTEIILRVGEKTFTRERCVKELGCPNFKAAANLSHALESIGVTSAKDLAKTTPADLLRLEGVGERTVFVALCVLDATSANGTADRWLHSDETKPDTRNPTPPPKKQLTPKEKARARHPRPSVATAAAP